MGFLQELLPFLLVQIKYQKEQFVDCSYAVADLGGVFGTFDQMLTLETTFVIMDTSSVRALDHHCYVKA